MDNISKALKELGIALDFLEVRDATILAEEAIRRAIGYLGFGFAQSDEPIECEPLSPEELLYNERANEREIYERMEE